MRQQKEIEAVRNFSRRFTRQMGLLREAPYDPALTLIESRVLFELAQGKALAKDLREILGVDKGYLSRVLAEMREKKQLLSLEPNPEDAREKRLALTAKGRRAFAKINRESQARTEAMLRSLGKANGRALAEHLSAASLALGQGSLRPEEIRFRTRLSPGDLGWVIQRHGELYAQEYGWDTDFENLVAEIALGFAKENDPKKERAWVAEARGVRLGCVFLVKESAQTAKLRILLVEPVARGLGLGRRLVQECVGFSRQAGYRRIVLWTNDVLHAARKIYESEGFRLEKEEAHRSFGKSLNGQTWAKEL